MTIEGDIMREVRAANAAMTVLEIQWAIGSVYTLREVQAALHRLDDAGELHMRNGFYSLTEKARRDSAQQSL